MAPTRTTHKATAKKGAAAHIPRPLNPWICFVKAQVKNWRAGGGPKLTWHVASKRAAGIWNSLSDLQKLPYQLEAESLKAIHKAQYPGYEYHPRQGGRKARRSRAVDADMEGSAEEEVPSASPTTLGGSSDEVTESSIDSDAPYEAPHRFVSLPLSPILPPCVPAEGIAALRAPPTSVYPSFDLLSPLSPSENVTNQSLPMCSASPAAQPSAYLMLPTDMVVSEADEMRVLPHGYPMERRVVFEDMSLEPILCAVDGDLSVKFIVDPPFAMDWLVSP